MDWIFLWHSFGKGIPKNDKFEPGNGNDLSLLAPSDRILIRTKQFKNKTPETILIAPKLDLKPIISVLKKELDPDHKPVIIMAGADARVSSVKPEQVAKLKNMSRSLWWEGNDSEDPDIKTVPMGLWSLYLLYNGIENAEKAIKSASISNKPMLVAGTKSHFWATMRSHEEMKTGKYYEPERVEFSKFLKKPKYDWIHSKSWESSQYWKKLSECQYYLCPLGLGVQAPKIAQCWMVKTVPVCLAKHRAFQDFKKMGFPILLIDKWEDLSPKFLQYKYKDFAKVNWENIKEMLSPENVFQMLTK